MLPTRFPSRGADNAAGLETLLPAASRAVLSEFIATAVFVFAAEGSVYGLWKMYKDTGTLGGLLVVAVAHALALAAAVALASGASGGHVNPAVTFGVLVGRRISFARAVLYWAAQLLGSVLAAALLRIISGGVVIKLFSSQQALLFSTLRFPLIKLFRVQVHFSEEVTTVTSSPCSARLLLLLHKLGQFQSHHVFRSQS
ncbi:hypothetical protein ACQJBY_010829 [Aegilops geniculata]